MKINGTLRNTVYSLPLLYQLFRLAKYFSAWRAFKRDFYRFKKMSAQKESRFPIEWADRYPCLNDKTATTAIDLHYTYFPAWAARILKKTMPTSHIDISSILNFSTIVSAFIPLKSYHYQPVQITLSGLTLDKADLLKLPFSDNSIQSLSCMHVVEHIGLGRYGDTLNPDDDCKAISELKRVLEPGGNLLFVVPVGKPHIQFNAHRIYSHEQIMNYFSDLTLCQFALVPDDNSGSGIIENATAELADKQSYGCGCFWFRK